MYVKDLIAQLQKLDPESEAMISLSDCRIVAPVSYVEEAQVDPDESTGLYRDDTENGSVKIAMIGYVF